MRPFHNLPRMLTAIAASTYRNPRNKPYLWVATECALAFAIGVITGFFWAPAFMTWFLLLGIVLFVIFSVAKGIMQDGIGGTLIVLGVWFIAVPSVFWFFGTRIATLFLV